MKEIALSARGTKHRGRYIALVDDEDYVWLVRHNWRVHINGTGTNRRVYAVRQVVAPDGSRTDLRMHREVWARVNGPIPAGREIDHAEPGELGGLDNRRRNLRLATKSLNQANSRPAENNSSGFKGVHRYKRWRAQITIDGRARHLGYFDTPEEAAKAYDQAAVSAFGTHARPNFPAAGA